MDFVKPETDSEILVSVRKLAQPVSHFCLLNLLINTKVAYNKYYTRTVIRNVGNR